MTIANNYVPIKQAGNGSTKSFTFDFRLLEEDYLVVFQEINNTQTVVSEDDYTVNMEEVGGTVDFKTAPAAGTYIIITRNVPLDQLTPYRTSSGFPADRVEENLDKLTAITQQLSDGLDRAPKLPVGTTGVDVTLPLPDAGKAIIWNEDGTGFENSEANFDEVVEEATEQANIATQKANEAAQSASSASASASSAAQSAQNAEDSANEAQAVSTYLPYVLENVQVQYWNKTDMFDDYPYTGEFTIQMPTPLQGIAIESVSGQTVFNLPDATSGNYAPVCDIIVNQKTINVSIYAKKQPESTVVIPTVLIFFGRVQQ